MGRPKAEPQGTITIVGDDYLKSCGDRIARRLQGLTMSQADLAKELEVSEATVSRWVNGLAEPRRHHKRTLAEALGTKVHRLFAEEA